MENLKKSTDPSFSPTYSEGFRALHNQYFQRLNLEFPRLSNNKRFIETHTDFKNAISYIDTLPEQIQKDGDFFQDIYLDQQQRINYRLLFKNNQIQEYLKEQKVPISKLSVSDPLLYSDQKNVNPLKLEIYLQAYGSITRPIVTVYHPYIGRELIIDGNHRLGFALRKRIKSIPAYRLSAQQLFEILSFEPKSQALFTLHHNMMIFKDHDFGSRYTLLTHLKPPLLIHNDFSYQRVRKLSRFRPILFFIRKLFSNKG